MNEMVQERHVKDGFNTDNAQEKNFHEYAVITESLLRDLETCKGEQLRCRMELETLFRESKRATEMAKETLSQGSMDRLPENQNYQECLENLQKRISILEMEKETIFQMWQMTLKTVSVLEEELKSTQKDDKPTKYYEEQMKSVQEMYSEAIRALESKLLRAKENFEKNQALWESNREKTENLSKEKAELERRLSALESEYRSKEETNLRQIEFLKMELDQAQNELEKSREEKLELHEKLLESRTYATRMVAKNEESKNKVSEALEIAEAAIREKELSLERESRTLEEKNRLESRLNSLVDEYTSRLDKELTAARESFERSSKKCALDAKEFKIELREKITLLDRVEREKRLLEEELEKVRRESDIFLQKSSCSILELEEKLKEAHSKMENCEENCRRRCEEKIRLEEERITDLETRLSAANERLRRTQISKNKELDERVQEADDRVKEILERYSVLERRLARSLDEKENIACEMRTMRAEYDREITRRDTERRLHEARIRELQDNLQESNNTLEKANARSLYLAKQIESLQHDFLNKQDVGYDSRVNEELMLRLKNLQEKFDQRTKELTQHVETHQKLCRRWKDEAKSLTIKFQARSKEFRDKMNILRKENEKLNKELLACRQHLANCRIQVLNRYDHDDETR